MIKNNTFQTLEPFNRAKSRTIILEDKNSTLKNTWPCGFYDSKDVKVVLLDNTVVFDQPFSLRVGSEKVVSNSFFAACLV